MHRLHIYFCALIFAALPARAWVIGQQTQTEAAAYVASVSAARAEAGQSPLTSANVSALHRVFNGLDRLVGRENIIFGFIFAADFNAGAGSKIIGMFGRAATAYNSPVWAADGITTSSFFSGSWQSRYFVIPGVPVTNTDQIASIYVAASVAMGGSSSDSQMRISTASNAAMASNTTAIWGLGNSGTGATASLNHNFKSLTIDAGGFVSASTRTGVPLVLTRSPAQMQVRSPGDTITTTAAANITFLNAISNPQNISVGTRSTGGTGTSAQWRVLLWFSPAVDVVGLRSQITSLLNNTVTSSSPLP